MKKTMLVLSILAAFTLTGCGGEQKSAPASKTPEAKPAVKVEEQQKVEYNEKGEKVYKMGKGKSLTEQFGKDKPQKGLHQFKTNNQ